MESTENPESREMRIWLYGEKCHMNSTTDTPLVLSKDVSVGGLIKAISERCSLPVGGFQAYCENVRIKVTDSTKPAGHVYPVLHNNATISVFGASENTVNPSRTSSLQKVEESLQHYGASKKL